MLCSATLEVGDYVLTPNVCVERKSVSVCHAAAVAAVAAPPRQPMAR